jgi:hypothetical protein
VAGIGRIVVGYREHDRRRLRLLDEYGMQSVAVRPCYAGCGYPVYFLSGGIDAVRDRDAEVVCTECKELYYPFLLAEV